MLYKIKKRGEFPSSEVVKLVGLGIFVFVTGLSPLSYLAWQDERNR